MIVLSWLLLPFSGFLSFALGRWGGRGLSITLTVLGLATCVGLLVAAGSISAREDGYNWYYSGAWFALFAACGAIGPSVTKAMRAASSVSLVATLIGALAGFYVFANHACAFHGDCL